VVDKTGSESRTRPSPIAGFFGGEAGTATADGAEAVGCPEPLVPIFGEVVPSFGEVFRDVVVVPATDPAKRGEGTTLCGTDPVAAEAVGRPPS